MEPKVNGECVTSHKWKSFKTLPGSSLSWKSATCTFMNCSVHFSRAPTCTRRGGPLNVHVDQKKNAIWSLLSTFCPRPHLPTWGSKLEQYFVESTLNVNTGLHWTNSSRCGVPYRYTTLSQCQHVERSTPTSHARTPRFLVLIPLIVQVFFLQINKAFY